MSRQLFEPGDRVIVGLEPRRDSLLGWRPKLRGTVIFAGYRDDLSSGGFHREVPIYSVAVDVDGFGWGHALDVLRVGGAVMEIECSYGNDSSFTVTVCDDPAQEPCLFPEVYTITENFWEIS